MDLQYRYFTYTAAAYRYAPCQTANLWLAQQSTDASIHVKQAAVYSRTIWPPAQPTPLIQLWSHCTVISQSDKCAGHPTLTEKWSQNGSVTWPMQTENYLGQEESLVKRTALGGHTYLPYIQTHCLIVLYKLAKCQLVIVQHPLI